MATVDVSVPSEVAPQRAWALASDLDRFGEWMTIFGGWRSPVPKRIREGTEVSSLIKVKGFRNVIHWCVTGYDEPHVIELRGSGSGGVGTGLTMRVIEDQHGSRFRLLADLSGGLLSGPVGRFVARLLESDVRRAVTNLAAMA